MINTTHLDVLRKICARLSDSKVSWAVTGSLGMALRGVPVEVHDIDIQTDRPGAYEIEHRLSRFVTRKVAFSSAENIRSHLGALTINGMKVEIMGDVEKRHKDGSWEDPPNLERHKRTVEVEGMRIRVLSLPYEYQAYLTLGRTDKAEMLRKWLKRKQSSSGNASSNRI